MNALIKKLMKKIRGNPSVNIERTFEEGITCVMATKSYPD